MTRDEAIAQVVCAHNLIEGDFGSFVDSLVRLGLLKLDERKTDGQMAAEYLMRLGPIIISDIPELLDRAGYKIVKA